MIKANALTLRRGTKILIQDAEFVVHPGERVGLIGRNGSGKSSLFAAFRGQLDLDQGNVDIPVTWNMAWVEQTIEDLERPAREYVIDGDRTLRQLQAAREQAKDGQAIAELETRLIDAGAWQANSRAESLLSGLGFKPDQWLNPVGSFSGGWQMRISLARALMAPSDLLLLDEPTNHLDLDAMLWLERWLTAYAGTVIIISHDVEFIDAVCNVILHIEHKRIERYRGDYQSFLTQRAEKLRQTSLAIERQARESARLQQFIDRFKAKASKAKQAQSRVKALARMQTLAPLQTETDIGIHIPEPEHAPNLLLRLKDIDAGYLVDGSPHTILRSIGLRIEAGSRIGILGVNGAGKSTLVKIIAAELDPFAGERIEGKGLVIGYFAQQQMDILDSHASALLHLKRIAPQTREQELRNYLARFGFTGEKVMDVVGPFSGGEKARLALALIVWHRPNLLVLDEPTNHLDVQTREALTTALAEYEGSLLLVSHDRHLLRTSVDQFWIVGDGQVTQFDGDLEDYRQHTLSRSGASTETSTDASAQAEDGSQAQGDRKQQKREQAQLRQQLSSLRKPLQSRLTKIETQMQALASRLEKIDQQMQDPTFYESADSNLRQQTLKDHGQLTRDHEVLEEQWLEVSQEIEELEAKYSQAAD
ncbi:ABC-F family ATP-binding cassette domain-containing protein [Orrella marina]|uniref:Probable ATP-binding protein YheS n=1 Tax=Orrella marina TaxID=2163011 RepID=A0A2R4XHR1_9BURK|nr:ATP-binding cassette domain-containing protein [Orrella marina]AWB33340.1 ABC transporter [Orrella marina]